MSSFKNFVTEGERWEHSKSNAKQWRLAEVQRAPQTPKTIGHGRILWFWNWGMLWDFTYHWNSRIRLYLVRLWNQQFLLLDSIGIYNFKVDFTLKQIMLGLIFFSKLNIISYMVQPVQTLTKNKATKSFMGLFLVS